MNPSAATFLFLIIALLGVGAYVFYATNPVSPKPKQDVPQASSSTTGMLAANVSNVQLEGDGRKFTVSGLAKDVIDPELTTFRVSLQGPSLNLEPITFTRVKGDLLVQNRTIKGGVLEVDVSTMGTAKEALNRELLEQVLQVRQYPQAKFVIRRVDKAEGNSAVFVGDLTLRGTTREVRVPFSRQGGALTGRIELDPAVFGIVMPKALNRVLVNFSVGIK